MQLLTNCIGKFSLESIQTWIN